MQSNIAIQMENISKTFGVIKANEDVNLTVYNGEWYMLSSERTEPAKATLMNMLSGIYSPDSGSIFIQATRSSLFIAKGFHRAGGSG